MQVRKPARMMIPVLLAVMLGGGPGLEAAGPSYLSTLTGTWIFSTVAGPGMTIPAVVTYHADGTITYSDATMFGGSAMAPYKFGTYNGVWQQIRQNRFGTTAIGLMFDPGTNAVIGFARGRSALRYHGNTSTLVGKLYLETVACPTPFTCPDPTNPNLVWTPFGDPNGFAIVLSRVTRVSVPPL
jgi:hypothetical protein